MKNILLTSLALLFACNIFAQTHNVDSLVNLLNTGKLSNIEQMEICKKLCSEYRKNNIENLMTFANKGLQIAINDNNNYFAADFYSYLSAGYRLYGIIDSAMTYANKGLKLAIATNNQECEIHLYRDLSVLHNSYKQYKDSNLALEYLFKALQIAEETKNKQNIVLVLNNLAQYYKVLRNYDRTKYYTERAKVIADEINYDYGKIQIYYILGEYYFMTDENEKSIETYMEMLRISRNYNERIGEILCLQGLAYTYCLGLGDLEKAEKYATECLRLAKEFGSKHTLSFAYTVLSYVYLYQKRYEECKETVLMVWKMDSLNIDLPALGNLAAAYLYTGELDKAYYFFQKYAFFLEDYTEIQFQRTIADMEIKYETEKKELRIAALEEKEKLYIVLGIAIFIVLLLAIVLLLIRHRINVQKRKLSEQQLEISEQQREISEQQREISEQQRELSEQKVKQLEQEKQLIATQAVLDGETAERSRLARDLHDGLGGMLSVVKLNLKDMKHYAIMDGGDVERFGKALDMLDQSIGELRRVAHHIMPESLMRYGLKVALEDFCHAIPGAHFQYFGENPRLDSRLEILIYRCGYELINNAVKHANATAINVQLMVNNGIVSLTVHDNGTGFDPQAVKTGMGLENIRTRIAVYNGKMNILSAPNKGTEISIEIESI